MSSLCTGRLLPTFADSFSKYSATVHSLRLANAFSSAIWPVILLLGGHPRVDRGYHSLGSVARFTFQWFATSLSLAFSLIFACGLGIRYL